MTMMYIVLGAFISVPGFIAFCVVIELFFEDREKERRHKLEMAKLQSTNKVKEIKL